jgi:hypothetical protein
LNTKYFYLICKYNAETDKNKKNISTDDMYVYFLNKQKREEISYPVNTEKELIKINNIITTLDNKIIRLEDINEL